MKRTLIVASTVFVALTACRDRQDMEKERVERTEPAPQRAEPESPYDISREQAEREQEIRERARAEERVGERGARPGAIDEDTGEAEKEPTAGKTTALSHLPKDCKAVAYADVSKVMNLPGAKEHLLPAFRDSGSHPELTQTIALMKEAGIDATTNVDAIALCAKELPKRQAVRGETEGGSERSKVVIVMTGSFPKDQLVPTLTERRGGEPMEVDGRKIYRDEARNLFVGQTDDGTAIAATDRDTFSQTLEGGGDYALPTDKAFALMLPAATMQNVLERFGDPAAKRLAGEVRRTMITFDESSNELCLSMEMPDHTKAAELGGVFKAVQEQWKSSPPSDAQEKRIADTVKEAPVSYDDEIVKVTVEVKDDQIQNTMRNLGDQVRESI